MAFSFLQTALLYGVVRDLFFAYHGYSFLSAGDGEVYVWDMNARRCVHKFRDEGCLKSTSLSASKDGQYLACGWVSCGIREIVKYF